jgi:hypothetical protein
LIGLLAPGTEADSEPRLRVAVWRSSRRPARVTRAATVTLPAPLARREPVAIVRPWTFTTTLQRPAAVVRQRTRTPWRSTA